MPAEVPTKALRSTGMPPARFAGRVALVTGGGSGIGAATVRTLAAGGARVAVLDLDAERGQAMVDEVNTSGGQAALTVGNTASESDAEWAVNHVESLWGKLDIVVNNAGKPPPDVAIEDLDLATWNRTFEELQGCFLVTKHAVQLMKKQTGHTRSIVFVASMAALKGVALRQSYCAMKHGVLGLSRALAMELAPDHIRVNCVAVGPVNTSFLRRGADTLDPDRRLTFERGVPLGRIGEPEDIANTIAHLASDDSLWVTGDVFRMAGGSPAG